MDAEHSSEELFSREVYRNAKLKQDQIENFVSIADFKNVLGTLNICKISYSY